MNSFDAGILHFLNQYARHSEQFDLFVGMLASNYFFKGAALVAALWWAWFHPGSNRPRNREVVLATLAGSVAAEVFGRLLAMSLPMRLRPMQNPDFDFQLPYGVNHDQLRGWSAFPSDHAMVFFCVAAGLWFVSRPLGIMLSAYIALMMGLPRVYLGLHHPTDIIGGALIGIGFAWLVNRDRIRRAIATPLLAWSETSPGLFYACLFLFSHELTILFDELRNFGASLFHLLVT